MNIEGEVKYKVVTDAIIQPQNDERKYKYIRLNKNKLDIVFVQDHHEGKSAAAVNVNAGCLQDPLHRQGNFKLLQKNDLIIQGCLQNGQTRTIPI